LEIITARPRTIRDYYFAASAEETLAYLTAHHGRAQIVAGGTLLLPQVQRGEAMATHLVDVSRVGTMRCVCHAAGLLAVGGAMTLKALACHDRIRQDAPLLYEAAQLIATPQVRALATLGGNVASAGGSAEMLVALIALEAEAEIRNMTGAQWLPVENLTVRSGVSRIDSTSEVLARVRLSPLGPAQGVSMARINGMASCDRSPLALALVLSLSPDGATVTDCAVALGTCQGVPHRAPDVESAVAGQDIPGGAARDALRAAIAQWVQERRLLASAPTAIVEQMTPLAEMSFDHALQMAQRRQAANGRP
jgi:CO/xanthine dehydrogenase FAD-binding subunit